MATYKQKLAAQKIVENGGNIGKAMEDAGYSKNTAKTPQKLTESKGWDELWQSAISDELIIQKLSELLHAVKIRKYVFPINMSKTDIKKTIESIKGCTLIRVETYNHCKEAVYLSPDTSSILKVLDMVLRLEGRYPKTKYIQLEDPYEHMSDEELTAKSDQLREKLRLLKGS